MKQRNKEICPNAISRGFASKYGLYDCNYEGICEHKHKYNGYVYCKIELDKAVDRGRK